jgi:hypothetical protein
MAQEHQTRPALANRFVSWFVPSVRMNDNRWPPLILQQLLLLRPLAQLRPFLVLESPSRLPRRLVDADMLLQLVALVLLSNGTFIGNAEKAFG